MASFIALSSSLSPNVTPKAANDQFLQALRTPAGAIMADFSSQELATAMTLKDLISHKAEQAGVDEKLALKIAFCESRLRQFGKSGKPLRGEHNPDDIGLFQINETYHAKKSQSLGFDIHTTEGNIDYAMWLLQNQGSKPWYWSEGCWGAQVA